MRLFMIAMAQQAWRRFRRLRVADRCDSRYAMAD
jgi:hypothetical protein